jgi:cytochrome P450
MRVLVSRLKLGGLSEELPIVKWIAALMKLVPIPAVQSMIPGNDMLMDYALTLVHSIKASNSASNIFANVAAEAEKGQGLDDVDVQIEASSFLVAASDTTAMTLSYLIWAVLSRPSIQQRLEQEVAALSGDYTDAELEKLPFLGAVIDETLRLYGAAPGSLPRAVPRDGVTFGDFFLPGGTTVTTQAYSFHRDASLWPRPLE